MKISYPKYYKIFRFIASACPDSCCKEWAVDVDPDAASFYRKLPGDLGDRLRQVLKDGTNGAYMEIENGRCPMWRTDGLCRIQAELGHDALCKTCREFPRLRHDYGDFAELGLELSCPEAAKFILSPDCQDICSEETQEAGDAECDTEVMAILLKSRSEALALLEDTAFSVPQALAALLLYGYEVQEEIDGGEPLPPDFNANLEQAKQFAKNGDSTLFVNFFKNLELLTPQWRERLNAPMGGQWSDRFRLLAKYFVMRYWLQAVSDYDLVCRVKLVIASCLLVQLLGGDLVETAQLFSKEIENDPDNVEAILDGAYTSPALTDANLLGLLLNT